jgi:ABC-type multidrug transport system fused ATPase/permease subunit
VYIFDEATSNIDMESEELIMRVIRQLAKSRTVILISHRLANVVSSDRIYMLEEGRVIESGTHRELMTVGGSYRKLYRRQRALESYSRGQKDTAAGRRRKPAVKTERRPKHEENQ